jgi:hypothetical protein
MQPPQITFVGYLIAAVIVVLVLSFRLRRMKRSVPLKVERLWIVPAILTAAAGITLAQFPLKWLDGIWLAVAFVIGGVLGWQRGRLMNIVMNPADRTLTRQATPLAIYFLVGLVVIRLGLRAGLGMEARSWGLSPAFINDVFVIFGTGLFIAQALEMGIRARRVLAAASTGGPSAEDP